MNDLLPFLVSGMVAGCLYGLTGVGLVLTYKTSGLFNFSYGAVGAAAAYIFYFLYIEHDAHWVVAFIVSVPLLGTVLGFLFQWMAHHLTERPPAMRIAGTIGPILVVSGLATVRWGHDPLRLPQFLPSGTEAFSVADVRVTYGQVSVIAVALVVVVALTAVFKFTRLGITMRAVVESPDLVALHGSSPRRTRTYAWLMGTTITCLAGVLLAPLVGIDVILLTFVVVHAFAAAAVGRFTSITVTFLGALGIGVLAATSQKYVVNTEWLRGVPASVPFAVLIVALLLFPPRRGAEERGRGPVHAPSWRPPVEVQVALGAVALVALVAVPHVVGIRLSFFTVGLTQAIALLSLGFIVRTAGLISLCHTVFAAIGAVAFAHLGEHFNLPWPIAVLVGCLVVVPVASLVALPASRLSPLFFPLATLAFGIMVQSLLYARGFMFTTSAAGLAMPRPSFATSDEAFYYVVLGCLVLTAAVVIMTTRARLGRMMRVIADSSLAGTTMGMDVRVTRVLAFAVSGALAGLSGILYGSTVHVAVYTDARYTTFTALVLLALVVILPFRAPWYAVLGGVVSVIPGYWRSPDNTSWLNVIFGVSLVFIAVEGGHMPVPRRLRALFDRLGRRASPEAGTGRPVVSVASPGRARVVDPAVPALEVRDLAVQFGGLRAVDGVSLSAAPATLVGLIGPNGAGKTTIFNACSGLVRPSAGQILLKGEDVTDLDPWARARRGVGRTFQVPQLCESLTVTENLEYASEAFVAGRSARRQLTANSDDKARARAAARYAMELCGISSIESVRAGALPPGQRRLVELARCLAAPFDVLLLDEPSAGLDAQETRQFAAVLGEVVQTRGCAILLVEHDIELVMRVCSHVHVLASGAMLASGPPEAIRQDPAVQAAYLGLPETVDTYASTTAP